VIAHEPRPRAWLAFLGPCALATVLVLLGGVGLAVLWADQVTLHVINAATSAVTVSGCGDQVVVPAGETRVSTGVCWRARQLEAHATGEQPEPITLAGSGAYVINVAARAALCLVDYSAAYTRPNERLLPPEARARIVADLRQQRVVSIGRGYRLLRPGQPLPQVAALGTRVLRLEPVAARSPDPVELERHFTRVMRRELTPGNDPEK
jgi:hypothetical protein